MGSYGGHLLLVGPVKWAIRNPQPGSFKLETWRLLYPSYANVASGREHSPTTILIFFFFWLTRFVFSDLLGLFYFVRYLNQAVWPSMWCHFLDISYVKQFWGPLVATFSSWMLSSGLNCARELRASSLKHQDCCSHHLQTWFVEGYVVRQLDSRFLSFRLAS